MKVIKKIRNSGSVTNRFRVICFLDLIQFPKQKRKLL